MRDDVWSEARGRMYALIALVILALVSGASARAGDSYAGFEKVFNKQDSSDGFCQRAYYSVNFERWLKFYLHGKDAEADKQWLEVLKQTKGADSLNPLFRKVSNRVMMMDDPDTKLFLDRGGIEFLHEHLVKVSGKALGETPLMATVLESALTTFDSSRQWTKVEENASRCAKIYERNFGKDSYKLKRPYRLLTKAQLHLNETAKAKTTALSMIALGKQLKEKEYIADGQAFLREADASATATHPKNASSPP